MGEYSNTNDKNNLDGTIRSKNPIDFTKKGHSEKRTLGGLKMTETTPIEETPNEWVTYELDANGNVGGVSSVYSLSSIPYIAYYDADNTSIRFIQAQSKNPLFTDWSKHIATTDGASLSIVSGLYQGKPTVSYMRNDGTNAAKFIYSSEVVPAGVADWSNGLNESTSLSSLRLASVSSDNGPAILYFNGLGLGNVDLKFLRANTEPPAGAWNIHDVITGADITGAGVTFALNVAIKSDDKPAICYYTEGDAKIFYAYSSVTNPTSSTDWTIEEVITLSGTNKGPTKMRLIDDQPTIIYQDDSLKMIRRTSDGSWSIPTTITALTAGGFSNHSIDIFGGTLGVTFEGGDNFLYYMSSSLSNLTNWTVESVDRSGFATLSSLKLMAAGSPFISYRDSAFSSLRIAYKQW